MLAVPLACNHPVPCSPPPPPPGLQSGAARQRTELALFTLGEVALLREARAGAGAAVKVQALTAVGVGGRAAGATQAQGSQVSPQGPHAAGGGAGGWGFRARGSLPSPAAPWLPLPRPAPRLARVPMSHVRPPLKSAVRVPALGSPPRRRRRRGWRRLPPLAVGARVDVPGQAVHGGRAAGQEGGTAAGPGGGGALGRGRALLTTSGGGGGSGLSGSLGRVLRWWSLGGVAAKPCVGWSKPCVGWSSSLPAIFSLSAMQGPFARKALPRQGNTTIRSAPPPSSPPTHHPRTHSATSMGPARQGPCQVNPPKPPKPTRNLPLVTPLPPLPARPGPQTRNQTKPCRRWAAAPAPWSATTCLWR